jgi:hypothetical protein
MINENPEFNQILYNHLLLIVAEIFEGEDREQQSIVLTFLMFCKYNLIASLSTVASKPKKDLILRLASCSKQVHSGFSGCT